MIVEPQYVEMKREFMRSNENCFKAVADNSPRISIPNGKVQRPLSTLDAEVPMNAFQNLEKFPSIIHWLSMLSICQQLKIPWIIPPPFLPPAHPFLCCIHSSKLSTFS